MQSAEAKLKQLGIVLPPAPQPAANYVTAVRTGNLLFVSGQGPVVNGQVVCAGVVGDDVTEQQGYDAARITILNALAIVREHAGSLDKVARIVKLLGWVRCVPGFQVPHKIINGASDLLVEIFGERGRHARSAVTAQALPFGIAVEIEMVVELLP